MVTGASTADAAVVLIDVTQGPAAADPAPPADRAGCSASATRSSRSSTRWTSSAIARDVRGGVDASSRRSPRRSASRPRRHPGVRAARRHGGRARRPALSWYRRSDAARARSRACPEAPSAPRAGPFRFPVQLVSRRDGSAPRGYMGRIESGHRARRRRGPLLPSGRRTRVRQILDPWRRGASIAVAGDSVTLVLADELDLARGDLIADAAGRAARDARRSTRRWSGSGRAAASGGRYLVQHGSRRVVARAASCPNTSRHRQPARDPVRGRGERERHRPRAACAASAVVRRRVRRGALTGGAHPDRRGDQSHGRRRAGEVS